MDGQRRERLWRAVTAAEAARKSAGWGQAVCAACVVVLASVDAAAVTLRTPSRAQELHGASDAWAAELEELRYTLGEGAGVQAFTEGGPVLIGDVAAEQPRWPAYAEAAQRAGAAAVFAFPLQIGAIRLGTLDLYRRRPGSLHPAEVTDAAILADLAATALLHQFEFAERAGREAPKPVTSYEEVNIATGMLAAGLQLSLDDAFARLRAHAYLGDRSVLDVARDLVRRNIDLDQLAE